MVASEGQEVNCREGAIPGRGRRGHARPCKDSMSLVGAGTRMQLACAARQGTAGHGKAGHSRAQQGACLQVGEELSALHQLHEHVQVLGILHSGHSRRSRHSTLSWCKA